MKKFLLLVAAMICLATVAKAQFADGYVNAVLTSVPSLTITPDARSGGMGDVGCGTEADIYSQHYNPAKYAFIEDRGGVSVSYTPWLRKIVSDLDLAYVTGYYNIGEQAGTVSASFRYFSMGKVAMYSSGFASEMGDAEYLGDAHPNEWSLDVAYSRKLSENWSAGVAFRYIHSDLNNGANYSTETSKEYFPANAFAADVAFYMDYPLQIPMGTSHLRGGINLSNLGSKISYDKKATSNFLPADMRIGLSYELPFDDYNTLTVAVDCDKLLVPSSKSKYCDTEQSGYDPEDKSTWNLTQDQYNEISSAKGWFQSFHDAPYGSLEEFKEVNWSMGLEYAYNHQFFGRVGYHHEDKIKGNRRYVTVGAGFRLSMFELDVAYVIATAQTNPLDQTLRFSLAWNMPQGGAQNARRLRR